MLASLCVACYSRLNLSISHTHTRTHTHTHTLSLFLSLSLSFSLSLSLSLFLSFSLSRVFFISFWRCHVAPPFFLAWLMLCRCTLFCVTFAGDFSHAAFAEAPVCARPAERVEPPL